MEWYKNIHSLGVENFKQWISENFTRTSFESVANPANTTSLLLGGAVFLTSFYTVSWYRRHRRNPPGPAYLPILGNVSTFHENEYLHKYV